MKIWKRKPKDDKAQAERDERIKEEIRQKMREDAEYRDRVKTKVRKRLNGQLEPGGSNA